MAFFTPGYDPGIDPNSGIDPSSVNPFQLLLKKLLSQGQSQQGANPGIMQTLQGVQNGTVSPSPLSTGNQALATAIQNHLSAGAPDDSSDAEASAAPAPTVQAPTATPPLQFNFPDKGQPFQFGLQTAPQSTDSTQVPQTPTGDPDLQNLIKGVSDATATQKQKQAAYEDAVRKAAQVHQQTTLSKGQMIAGAIQAILGAATRDPNSQRNVQNYVQTIMQRNQADAQNQMQGAQADVANAGLELQSAGQDTQNQLARYTQLAKQKYDENQKQLSNAFELKKIAAQGDVTRQNELASREATQMKDISDATDEDQVQVLLSGLNSTRQARGLPPLDAATVKHAVASANAPGDEKLTDVEKKQKLLEWNTDHLKTLHPDWSKSKVDNEAFNTVNALPYTALSMLGYNQAAKAADTAGKIISNNADSDPNYGKAAKNKADIGHLNAMTGKILNAEPPEVTKAKSKMAELQTQKARVIGSVSDLAARAKLPDSDENVIDVIGEKKLKVAQDTIRGIDAAIGLQRSIINKPRVNPGLTPLAPAIPTQNSKSLPTGKPAPGRKMPKSKIKPLNAPAFRPGVSLSP